MLLMVTRTHFGILIDYEYGDMDKEELDDYLEARESQLNNVLSSPIGTDDYSMPSAEQIDETIYLEDEIETTKNPLKERQLHYTLFFVIVASCGSDSRLSV